MSAAFRYTKIRKNPGLFLVWFLFSIITGFSIAAICTTGGDLDTFYDRGDFLPIYSNNIVSNSQNLIYDSQTDVFSVSGDNAQIFFNSYSKNNAWNYLDASVSDLSGESLPLSMFYFNKENALVGEELLVLKAGENLLEVHSEPFSYAVAYIDAPQGASFRFEQFQFCTELPIDAPSLFGTGMLCSALCLLLTYGIFLLFQKSGGSPDWYAPIRGLEALYLAFGSRFVRQTGSLSASVKRVLRVLIMTGMFIALSFVNVYDLYFDDTVHRNLMLGFLVCFLLLGVLSIEKELKPQNWKNPLVLSWFWFWLLTCISDFFVAKGSSYFSFYGYFMLFAAGFLFFVWSNRADSSGVFEELCLVLKLTFFLCTAYCLLFRPETVGFRYKGFYNNPNPFGLYLAIVGCAIFCDLTRCLKKRALHPGQLIWCCIELSMLVFFLFKTQSATAVLSFGFMVFCWLLKSLHSAHALRHEKRVLIALLAAALCYLPVSAGLQWGITNIPRLLDTTIAYPGEVEYADNGLSLPSGAVTVYAAENDDEESSYSNRLLEKLTSSGSLNVLLSGRLEHYSTYLRGMNLFGHSKRPTVYGNNSNYAHNGFLACAHTYGVYIVIPYILMLLYYFYYALRYLRCSHSKNDFSFFPFSVFVVFFLENLMDNVDTPFHWIVWFIFSFVGGALFSMSSSRSDVQSFPEI